MQKLLALIFGFLRLGVGEDTSVGGGDAMDPGQDTVAPNDSVDDIQGDLLADVEDAPAQNDDPEPRAIKIDPAVEEARRSAEESRQRADRAEREAADLRARASQANSEEARLRADEDRVLNDPQADRNEKWRIEANRTIRQTNQMAASTAFQAQDIGDRSNFAIACSTNKRLAFVKDKVESELAKMRQNGQNAPRESIAYYVLGQMAANAKPKGAPKPAAKAGPRGGATGGVRSDVSGKSGQSERDKRRARLENQQI